MTERTGVASSLGYDGQYRDSESGFQYLRARYYDDRTGQLTSVDPLVAMTGQAYEYAANNPLNFSDPSGLFGLRSITSHWRGIAQFAVGATIAVGCTVATAGVGAIACGAIGGAVAGAFNYATNGASSHTLSGYLFNAGVGGVLGGIGGALGTST